MATYGKLEGRVTVPTGGLGLTVTETGGGGASDTATVPAGDYYWSSEDSEADDLEQAIEDALNAATLNATYTVSLDAGEGGTGRVTITGAGGSVTAIAIAWDNSTLRDLLGFASDGDVSGSLSHQGSEQARMLWISDTGWQSLNHAGAGGDVASQAAQESPDGAGQFVAVWGRRSVKALSLLEVARARMFVQFESLAGESLQQFWRDAIWCEHTLAKAFGGGPIRWYPDASDDSTYRTWKLRSSARQFRPQMTAPPLVARWRIDLEAVEQ